MKWALACLALLTAAQAQGAACVWKVTDESGRVLYLGGSWHALRSSDYPLPREYDQAFAASDRLVFEVDPRNLDRSGSEMLKAGEYPKTDSLKNHVDPRTYDYLRRFFNLSSVPEKKWNRYRPWFIAMVLQSPSLHGLSPSLGVEAHYRAKAESARKLITGLETTEDQLAIFSKMDPETSEAMLLLTFVPGDGKRNLKGAFDAWRRGDADYLASAMAEEYKDFPAITERVLNMRNRRWLPQLANDLASGQTYFVIVGAGHLGGPNGVVSLLRGQGKKVVPL